jgi:hypothetical protein
MIIDTDVRREQMARVASEPLPEVARFRSASCLLEFSGDDSCD